MLRVFDTRGFPTKAVHYPAFMNDLEKTIMGNIRKGYKVHQVLKQVLVHAVETKLYDQCVKLIV